MAAKIYLVARREYMENLRTKAFWIGILAFPLIIVLAAGVLLLLAQAKEVRTYAALDQSGFLLQKVDEKIFSRDLHKLFRAAEKNYRQGGPSFERLDEVVQQLTLALVKLGEDERDLFISLLAAEQPAKARAAQLPEETRVALLRLHPELRQWWRNLPAREPGGLDVKLSRSRYIRVGIPDGGEDPQGVLNHMINNDDLFAYFVVGADPVAGSDGCKYVSNNLTDRDLLNWFSRMAEEVVRDRRIAREDIDPQIARWIREPLAFQGRKVSEGGDEEEVEIRDTARQWVPLAFVYLLWIAIFTSAQMLLTNMIEEKSNRIIEVLLSSVSPFQLMAGKIAGMAASGLTVVSFWAMCFTILLMVPGMLDARVSFLGDVVVDPFYILSFVLYFLMGYLFYASILAGIGSVCNSLKETQNLMTPVLIPMMVPLLAMMPIGQDPNGILARVLSFIPPFTPFVMMNRAAGPPELWEYILTTLLMLGTIFLTVRGVAKVFRIGILMTGKPPRLREIVKWFTLGEGVVPASRETD